MNPAKKVGDALSRELSCFRRTGQAELVGMNGVVFVAIHSISIRFCRWILICLLGAFLCSSCGSDSTHALYDSGDIAVNDRSLPTSTGSLKSVVPDDDGTLDVLEEEFQSTPDNIRYLLLQYYSTHGLDVATVVNERLKELFQDGAGTNLSKAQVDGLRKFFEKFYGTGEVVLNNFAGVPKALVTNAELAETFDSAEGASFALINEFRPVWGFDNDDNIVVVDKRFLRLDEEAPGETILMITYDRFHKGTKVLGDKYIGFVEKSSELKWRALGIVSRDPSGTINDIGQSLIGLADQYYPYVAQEFQRYYQAFDIVASEPVIYSSDGHHSLGLRVNAITNKNLPWEILFDINKWSIVGRIPIVGFDYLGYFPAHIPQTCNRTIPVSYANIELYSWEMSPFNPWPQVRTCTYTDGDGYYSRTDCNDYPLAFNLDSYGSSNDYVTNHVFQSMYGLPTLPPGKLLLTDSSPYIVTNNSPYAAKDMVASHMLNYSQRYYLNNVVPGVGDPAHNDVRPVEFEINDTGCHFTIDLGLFTIDMNTSEKSCYLGGFDAVGIGQPSKIYYNQQYVHQSDNLNIWHEYGHVVQDIASNFRSCPYTPLYAYQEGYSDFIAAALEKGMHTHSRMKRNEWNAPEQFEGAGLYQQFGTYQSNCCESSIWDDVYRRGNIFAGTDFEFMNLIGNDKAQKRLWLQYYLMDNDGQGGAADCLAKYMASQSSVQYPPDVSLDMITRWKWDLSWADTMIAGGPQGVAVRHFSEIDTAYTDHGLNMKSDHVSFNKTRDVITNESKLGRLLIPEVDTQNEFQGTLSSNNMKDSFTFYSAGWNPGQTKAMNYKYHLHVIADAPILVKVYNATQDGYSRGSYERRYQVLKPNTPDGRYEIDKPNLVLNPPYSFNNPGDGWRYVDITNLLVRKNHYTINLSSYERACGTGSDCAFPVAATKGYRTDEFTIKGEVNKSDHIFKYHVPEYHGQLYDFFIFHIKSLSNKILWGPNVFVFSDLSSPECTLAIRDTDYDPSTNDASIIYPRKCANGKDAFIVIQNSAEGSFAQPYEFYLVDNIDNNFRKDMPHVIFYQPNSLLKKDVLEHYGAWFASKLYVNPLFDTNNRFDFDWYLFQAKENVGYTIEVVPLWGGCRNMWLDLDFKGTECSQIDTHHPQQVSPYNNPVPNTEYQKHCNMADACHYVECDRWDDYHGFQTGSNSEYRNTCSPVDRGFLFDGNLNVGKYDDRHKLLFDKQYDVDRRRIKFIAPVGGDYYVRVSMDSDWPWYPEGVYDIECGYVIAVYSDEKQRVGLPDYAYLGDW